MAKRGRKKDFNINDLNNVDEIVGMIVNQVNSLNKKIKAFKNEGIGEHISYVKHYLTEDMVKYSENDTITKSKKFYKDKSMIWLKKTLKALRVVNNNGYYGTVNKFNKEVNNRYLSLKSYVEEYLREKGYTEEFIYNATTDRQFFAKLYLGFAEGKSFSTSDQIIDKVALEYSACIGELSEKEVNEILNNIENSEVLNQRLHQDREDYQEYLRMKKRR